jgi:hypothetical protein
MVHSAQQTDATAEEAVGKSQTSPRRCIIINDFQLEICKLGLVALAREQNAEGCSDKDHLNRSQIYQLGLLVEIIEDVMKEPSDEQMIYGFTI